MGSDHKGILHAIRRKSRKEIRGGCQERHYHGNHGQNLPNVRRSPYCTHGKIREVLCLFHVPKMQIHGKYAERENESRHSLPLVQKRRDRTETHQNKKDFLRVQHVSCVYVCPMAKTHGRAMQTMFISSRRNGERRGEMLKQSMQELKIAGLQTR